MANKQLENELIRKVAKRFKRTSLEGINSYPKDANNYHENETYTIYLRGFRFRLAYSKKFNEEEIELELFDPADRSVEHFDTSDRNYSAILKDIYYNLKNRFVEESEKQKAKGKRELERKLNRLKRIL